MECNYQHRSTKTYKIPYGTNPRSHCEQPTAGADANAEEKAIDEFIKFAKAFCHRRDDKCEGLECNSHVRHIAVRTLRSPVSDPDPNDPKKFICSIEYEVSGDIFCDCGEKGGDTVNRL